MSRTLAAVSLLVRDHDEAIDFFTRVIRFRLAEDSPPAGGRRWVMVAPDDGAAPVLARAADDAQHAAVGRQSAAVLQIPRKAASISVGKRQWTSAGIGLP